MGECKGAMRAVGAPARAFVAWLVLAILATTGAPREADPNEVAVLYRKRLKIDPADADAWQGLGDALTAMHRATGGARVLSRARQCHARARKLSGSVTRVRSISVRGTARTLVVIDGIVPVNVTARMVDRHVRADPSGTDSTRWGRAYAGEQSAWPNAFVRL